MRHHTEWKRAAEVDDAVLAALKGEPRPCTLCGDTGLCGYTPCVCAHGVARGVPRA